MFGETYGDIASAPALEKINSFKLTAANLDTLSAADQHKVVLAVQQSSHTDVTTPAEALSRVDQQEINVTFLLEPLARRSFIAMEYGAGDNSYGAIFERWSGVMVTNIHDGDLETTVDHQRELVGPDRGGGEAGGDGGVDRGAHLVVGGLPHGVGEQGRGADPERGVHRVGA